MLEHANGRVPNPLALAVLGLLHERPMHPYEIAFEMRRRHLADHIKLSFGSLYHSVESLQKAAWIEPVATSRSGGRPERTVYQLTPEGVRAFSRRLADLLRFPLREYSAFEAGLAFIERLDREEGLVLLKDRLKQLRELARDGRERLRDRLVEGLPRLWVIEHEHAITGLEAEAAWLDRVIKEIESGELEWLRVEDPAPAEDCLAGSEGGRR